MPSAADRIFLCGPPGCGKSSVGRRLARITGRAFVDTDALVVARAGMPIHRIFAASGEAAFRALESEALADACTREGVVVALGGGTLLAPANRALVAASGRSFYLQASVATLEARVERQNARRPLLVGASIGTLLAQRRTLYEAADVTIDVDGLNIGAVAHAIAAQL